MIDHCVSTLKKERDETIYRNYIADTLRNIAQITAALGQGKYDAPRYAEFVEVAKEPKEEKTAEQVIDKISEKLARI